MTLRNDPLPASLEGSSAARTVKRLILATRPMFFTASVLPVLLGTGLGVRAAGTLDIWAFLLALLATIGAHAAVNVINDVYDDISGADPDNTGRIYPFTGGSRFIQEDIMTRRNMRQWGMALLTLTAALGLTLAIMKGTGVIWFGLIGICLGVFYSAPPAELSARGLGELAVGLGFGVLPVTGAAWLQSGNVDIGAVLISLPVSFWVFNILLINEIPDAGADAGAGKRTLVVRLGLPATRTIYLAANALAVLAIVLAVSAELLPAYAIALPLLLLLVAWRAARLLEPGSPDRSAMTTIIKTTLAIHLAGGLWLSVIVWLP